MKSALLISFLLAISFQSQAQLKADAPPVNGSAPAGDPTAKMEKRPTVSASYKAQVKKLMEATNATGNQEVIIEKVAESMAKDAKDPIKAKKSAFNFFKDVLSVDALLEDIAIAYSKHFSEAEVKKLVAFYQSPIGKKAAEKMPEVTKEMMMIGQLKLQLKMEEFKQNKAKMEGFQ